MKILTIAALGLSAACGGTSGAQQPAFQLISPFDDGNTGTTTVSASAAITTNNGSQPLLFIQGRVINDVDNGLIHYILKNGYSGAGTLPFGGPYPVIVTGGGAFDIVLADPLRHAFTPLEQEADNLITLQATNKFSSVDGNGKPVPIEAFVTITVRNGIKFDSPSYAKIVDGAVDAGCGFSGAGGITGTFSKPADISNTVLYRVDAADLPVTIDPESPVGTAVPFTFNASDGTFAITFDATSFDTAGFTDGQSDDNNFYIVFDSSDPDQLPQPGTIATLPFLACNATKPLP